MTPDRPQENHPNSSKNIETQPARNRGQAAKASTSGFLVAAHFRNATSAERKLRPAPASVEGTVPPRPRANPRTGRTTAPTPTASVQKLDHATPRSAAPRPAA